MTMHLVRGMSSIKTGKPEFKLTKKKRSEWEFDWNADNKLRKSQGMPKITFDEYYLNRLGKVKLPKPKFKPLSVTESKVSSIQNIPSLNSNVGNTYKKESMKYDGERQLIGIAVLHKSCLQPVFSKAVAEEISKMRRG